MATNRCNVAVIGAGAAGLVAARELHREGHSVVVFEQGRQPGGVWVYDEATDSDVIGKDERRFRVHSSMYSGLRTNLPRELMGFSDFPFVPQALGPAYSVDDRRFPSHQEVRNYLDAFADHFKLHSLVRYGARVINASHLPQPSPAAAPSGMPGAPPQPCWQVLSTQAEAPQASSAAADGAAQPVREKFDALVVCNGHYSEPNLPDVEGADLFPGLQLHSHNYRSPSHFRGQTVLVVGASNSGEDICREVAQEADHVIICARSWKNAAWASDSTPFGPLGNMERRGMVTRLHADGGAEFAEGAAVGGLDAIIYCTGYRYSFPFLDLDALGLTVRDQHVAPLYQHLFVPALAPHLSFIGIPWKVVPFPLFELQAKLVARLLSGRALLPSRSEMDEWVVRFTQHLQDEGIPARYSHMMNHEQWEYTAWLADSCGGDVARLPEWRASMYTSTGANKRAHPEDYRNRWDDVESVTAAVRDIDALLEGDAARAGGVPLMQRLAAGKASHESMSFLRDVSSENAQLSAATLVT